MPFDHLLQVREKQQKLAALQEQVQGQPDPSWADAMRMHVSSPAKSADGQVSRMPWPLAFQDWTSMIIRIQ